MFPVDGGRSRTSSMRRICGRTGGGVPVDTLDFTVRVRICGRGLEGRKNEEGGRPGVGVGGPLVVTAER